MSERMLPPIAILARRGATRQAEGRPLALGGLLVGLVLPLVLLLPMFYYEMEFMLYTWIWPTMCGAIGMLLSGLGWRRAGGDRWTRTLALAGLTTSLLMTALALAGWVGMILSMLAPAAPMPMG